MLWSHFNGLSVVLGGLNLEEFGLDVRLEMTKAVNLGEGAIFHADVISHSEGIHGDRSTTLHVDCAATREALVLANVVVARLKRGTVAIVEAALKWFALTKLALLERTTIAVTQAFLTVHSPSEENQQAECLYRRKIQHVVAANVGLFAYRNGFRSSENCEVFVVWFCFRALCTTNKCHQCLAFPITHVFRWGLL